MSNFLVLTQAPHASYYNGADTSTSREYWMRPTQVQENGPRIAAAVAGMVPGEFRAIWVNSAGGIFQVRSAEADDSGGYGILDWNPRGVWDEATQQIIIGGFRKRRKLIAYSDITGSWREAKFPEPLSRGTGTGHWYGMTTKDDSGGVYIGATGGRDIYKYDPATETAVISPTIHELSNGGNGAMIAWSPHLFTTGGLVKYVGSALRWIRYDPATGTWDRPAQGLGNNMHALLEYHPTHQRFLLLGGTSTSTVANLVTNNGVATTVTSVPDPISMSAGSWIVAHPNGYWLVTTFGTVPKLWAVVPNETLTDVTWVDLGTSPDSALDYPTAAWDSNRGLVYIVSDEGLYAYKPANLPNEVTLTPSNSLQNNTSSSVSITRTLTVAVSNGLTRNYSSTVLISKHLLLDPSASLIRNYSSTVAVVSEIVLSISPSLTRNYSTPVEITSSIILQVPTSIQRNYSNVSINVLKDGYYIHESIEVTDREYSNQSVFIEQDGILSILHRYNLYGSIVSNITKRSVSYDTN